jgi:hypothetical protein
MPDEFQYVKLPDGSYGKFRSDATDVAIRAQILKDFPDAYGESKLKQAGRGAALGAFSGLGIPETEHPISDLVSGLKEQTKDLFKRLPEEVQKYGVLGTPGVEAVRLAKNVGGGVAKSAAEAAEGAGANAQKPWEFGPVDIEKMSHGLASLAAQILMLKGGKEAAETPIAESEVVRGGKAVADRAEEVPRTMLREVSNVGESAVDAKRAEVAKANAEKVTAAKEKLAEKVGKREKTSIESSKQETAKRSYEDLKEKTAQEATANLDKASKMEKMALDSEYEDFAKKILGKDTANPNGTLQADIAPVAESVTDAQTNVLKGSEESIKQFKSIVGRLGKDVVAGQGEGELRPAPEMIPADQLRGYVTELNDKIYDADVPGDVRSALKVVRDSAQKQVSKAIEKKFGRSAVRAYEDLSARYNDYMDTWRDRSSGSPLPAIWKVLNQPMTVKRNIPAYREIADILTRKTGEKAIGVVARKKAFGADPSIIAKLRRADEALGDLGKPKKVPERPTPKAVKTETFDPQAFIRKGVQDRMTNVGNWGSGFMLLRGIADMMRGKAGAAGSTALDIALMQLIKRGLTKDKLLDWVSKEKP